MAFNLNLEGTSLTASNFKTSGEISFLCEVDARHFTPIKPVVFKFLNGWQLYSRETLQPSTRENSSEKNIRHVRLFFDDSYLRATELENAEFHILKRADISSSSEDTNKFQATVHLNSESSFKLQHTLEKDQPYILFQNKLYGLKMEALEPNKLYGYQVEGESYIYYFKKDRPDSITLLGFVESILPRKSSLPPPVPLPDPNNRFGTQTVLFLACSTVVLFAGGIVILVLKRSRRSETPKVTQKKPKRKTTSKNGVSPKM